MNAPRHPYNCDRQGDWDERAKTAVGLLAKQQEVVRARVRPPISIADFGAGNERLRPLLAGELDTPHEYLPYDIDPQLPTTVQLDVTRELPRRDFDVVICLGLLEYLDSVQSFAASLHAHCHLALVSYVARDNPADIGDDLRRDLGWVSHMADEDLEAAFATAGFSLLATAESDERATKTRLWRGLGLTPRSGGSQL